MTDISINQKFDLLNKLTNMVIDGITPSLIITGEGGLGKTYLVQKAIKDKGLYQIDWAHFKGYSTARGLYNTLYDNNGKLIIFDDCDSVLEDKVALNILKSALDSYETRTISWMAKMNKNEEYPQKFNFTGQIIFISNKSRSSIDGAILSRSLTVDLTMTSDEKIERMSHILKEILPEYPIEVKKDALEFIKEYKDVANLNLRTLIMVSKMRLVNSDWKEMAKYMIHS